ncbi:MAG: ABC transporter ATP-binding protein, partial [Dongiaceae bacterium]
FQDYALYPQMSVRQNLAFGLRIRKLPRDEIGRRVERAAALLGLEALLDRKPRELSGGQRQRVALGRAIVRDPKVFLFDEPLSNLDAKLRTSMRTELVKLHRQLGRTIIHVTHDQVEAMTMGQRICIMKDGRIVQVGQPLEVYRNPANTFVAGFLASPPMNLLEARLEADELTGLVAVHGALRLPIPREFEAAYGAYTNKPVILGIRPEDMYDQPLVGGTSFDARVVAVESLGPETVLVSEIADGAEVAARLDRGFSARAGEMQRLFVDGRQLHLFDPETTLAIPRPQL